MGWGFFFPHLPSAGKIWSQEVAVRLLGLSAYWFEVGGFFGLIMLFPELWSSGSIFLGQGWHVSVA